MKKRIFRIILLLITAYMNAQIVRPYVGFVTYLHRDFSSSVFLSLKTGGEFKISNYVIPEIEISGIYGALDGFVKKDDANRTIEENTISASSINFSVCPKINLGNEKELESYFVILPKFSISTIEAHRNHKTYDREGNSIISKRSIAKKWNNSFGLGIGYNFNFSSENSDSLCIILDLQGVELGKALNEVSNSESRIITKWTFGLGLNYYFNLKSKKA